MRLLQKSPTMQLLSLRLCGNLGPHELNFDISLNLFNDTFSMDFLCTDLYCVWELEVV